MNSFKQESDAAWLNSWQLTDDGSNKGFLHHNGWQSAIGWLEAKLRKELRGSPDSELWGENGLIAATMRCVDDCQARELQDPNGGNIFFYSPEQRPFPDPPSKEMQHLLMLDSTLRSIYDGGGTMGAAIAALVRDKKELQRRLLELEQIAPRKVVLDDGKTLVWNCPPDSIPESRTARESMFKKGGQ